MKYIFDSFVLDLDRGELRDGAAAVAVEPRAFGTLCYLVSNGERLVSKDELVEKIWDGRAVTDAAISTVIKGVRRALGDDGRAQKYIRTLHGRGFRFVGAAQARAEPAVVQAPAPAQDSPADTLGAQPTIAVLPFRLIGSAGAYGAISEAVPSELISSLSRLRWLRVIARGSTFRFRDHAPDIDTIRDTLGASYCLAGDIELFGPRLAISVELSDTRTGNVVWGERLTGKIDDVHMMRDEFANLVVSAMELHIPLHESEQARLRPPEALDAWSAYHLGLQHMYRFNRADNAYAASYFKRATELDPNFARAHAARSFTSFQSAFLRYGSDRAAHISDARRYAEKSIELDPMDPFGNFNFGRAHWLVGDTDAGQAWLERAMRLSPSFAQGYYAHAFADVMAGQGHSALDHVDKALSLSPLDPFLYAMQSAKGLANLHTGDLAQAAHWADQGARKPGAHHLIAAIAAAANQMAGREDVARYWVEQTLARRPDTSIKQFFTAFPFQDATVRQSLYDALRALGFQES
ncbi:winged helix-turn-helix domain-containing tetratricopeptide repeat protein [Actibacterium sp. XHP0104]|uniref:winged helix-turn-helix domain-containing tetratricopeptide repeat protein n=1 Tax=Actibacterium sp. XHP0104 TaxID=2984335 RepID=UPI0021E887A6|nr:winged helix-turn-helix domain-containing protein [Actibacterium sp. XHP0104]MCV2880407.1 winged helix-turn-helix domain-containing protein [Actibacterium sp. XHP0104]